MTVTYGTCRGCDVLAGLTNGYCPRCWEEVTSMRHWQDTRLAPWIAGSVIVIVLFTLLLGQCVEIGG
jgi:uncharacterized paraquat-inducible protein A